MILSDTGPARAGTAPAAPDGYDADVLPTLHADDPAGWTSRTRRCVDCGTDYDRVVCVVCPMCGRGEVAASPTLPAPMPTTPLETRRELEARVGVDYLDEVQARRAALVAEAAPLRAARDTFDARRKAERGQVLVLLNAERVARLAEIEARLDAATPGEWTTCVVTVSDDSRQIGVASPDVRRVVALTGRQDAAAEQEQSWADAALIAHAPADLRALLAEVLRLRAEVATMLPACEALGTAYVARYHLGDESTEYLEASQEAESLAIDLVQYARPIPALDDAARAAQGVADA